MPILSETTKITDIQQIGLGGLNTINSPSDINDIELSNVRNCVFDDGILQPRKGSLLDLAKPSGETSNPFQLFVATDSNGIDYGIANYGTNFYLRDTINTQWIKLNQAYTPTSSGIFRGSVSWNAGITSDVFYFGDGISDTMKWNMSVNTLATTTDPGDTTLTLNSAVSFPSSGSAIVMNAGTAVVLPYTSVGKSYTASTIAFVVSGTTYTITDSASGFVTAGFAIGDVITTIGTTKNAGQFTIINVAAGTLTVTEMTTTETAGLPFTLKAINSSILNLSGTVGQIIPSGSTVTVSIVDATSVPVASVFCTFQGRLFVANAQGAENTLHYSVVGNPENYSITATVISGGFYTLYKGKGGILGMTDYGTYLTIQKEDVISQFSFNIASDNSGFIVQVFPLISGDDIGPATSAEILQYMNIVYYPTLSAGIVSFNPSQTGTSTGSVLNLLSQSINNIVTESFDFSLSRTAALGQKLYWLVSFSTIGTPIGVNNLVMMYDLVRASENSSTTVSAWTLFDNWNAVDVKPINGVLYYLSQGDGALYQAFQGYQDALDNQPHPYNAYALTKRFNLNSPATLYRPQFVYIEGTISINTTLYVRVLDNEGGSLGSQAYQILGNNQTITSSFTAGLGRFMLGSALLGGVDLNVLPADQTTLQFFRVYLEVSQAFRVHNLQMEIFSVDEGSQWGVSKLSIVSQPETSIETALVLSPSSAPIITPVL